MRSSSSRFPSTPITFGAADKGPAEGLGVGPLLAAGDGVGDGLWACVVNRPWAIADTTMNSPSVVSLSWCLGMVMYDLAQARKWGAAYPNRPFMSIAFRRLDKNLASEYFPKCTDLR